MISDKFIVLYGSKVAKEDGKLHPTIAGLLMFGEEYKIRYEFPEYFLDYRENLDPTIRWTDRLESSSGEWSGNLVDFFFQMERKLLRDLKRPFKLEGITRVDETPVHKAILEALCNCIVNADFHFSRGIVIKKDADSIVIENPGSIITGKAQMLKGGISEPRNKTIMKMFNLIRVGERAGSGVPDIFSVWEDEGWVEPSVEERYKPDRTTLVLSFEKRKQAIKTSDNQVSKTPIRHNGGLSGGIDGGLAERIIDQISSNNTVTVQEMSVTLGIPKRTLEREMRRLRESKRITRVGGNRYGYWEIIE